MQIDLNYPLDSGTATILAKADEIAADFKAGQSFTYNSNTVIIRSCGASVGRELNGWYNVMLTIQFYSRVSRA
jgi:hypothetical protein